jgi:hypothetical protein
MNRTLALITATLLTGCPWGDGDDDVPPLPPLAIADGCNPLFGGGECFLPYPSDHFLQPDASLPSGKRLVMQGAGMLISDTGKPIDPTLVATMDGFSRVPTIMFSMLTATATDGLVRIDDNYDLSTKPDTSATLLINAGTGEAIPHFVDVDPEADDPSREGLMIRPMIGLDPQTRYIVAVHGLTAPDSSLIDAPEGFRRLRDDRAKGDPVLWPLAQRYETEIFPALVTAGLERSALQLAWDFTTASEFNATADMFAVRDAAIAALDEVPPVVEISDIEEPDDAESKVWRIVRGTISAPMFLESTDLGAALNRDNNGVIVQNDRVTFRFTAVIPKALMNRFEAGRVIGFGHGFFGGLDETTGDAVVGIAEHLNAVVVGIKWWGMTSADAPAMVGDMSTQPGLTTRFSERMHQAMVNWIATGRAMKSVLRQADGFVRPSEAGQPGVSEQNGVSNAGESLIAPDFAGFIGISQGHLLGGVLAALSPDFERIVLNVGGCCFTHLMSRSSPFNTYLMLIEQTMARDPFLRQKVLNQFATPFDRIDPGMYARYVLNEPLPGSPPDRQVLMQTGYADTSVPDFTAYLHARLLDIPLLKPSTLEPWGLKTTTGPVEGSAYTLFHYGVDDAFRQIARPAMANNEVHNSIRHQVEALNQMDAFMRPGGSVIHPCDGACDPN